MKIQKELIFLFSFLVVVSYGMLIFLVPTDIIALNNTLMYSPTVEFNHTLPKETVPNMNLSYSDTIPYGPYYNNWINEYPNEVCRFIMINSLSNYTDPFFNKTWYSGSNGCYYIEAIA